MDNVAHNTMKTPQIKDDIAFAKLEGMVGIGKARFEVAQQGIDSPELRQISRLAAGGDDDRMRPPGIGDSVEARQTIGEHLAVVVQRAACPVFYVRTGKPSNAGESGVEKMPLIIDRKRLSNAPLRVIADQASAGFFQFYGRSSWSLLLGTGREFFEHVAKVREGFDTVELTGFDNAVEGSRPFALRHHCRRIKNSCDYVELRIIIRISEV